MKRGRLDETQVVAKGRSGEGEEVSPEKRQLWMQSCNKVGDKHN